MTQWELACSNCKTPFARSTPMPKPKVGDCLAAQQWVYANGQPTKVGDPYVCGKCCTWFQPMVEYLTIYEGDSNG